MAENKVAAIETPETKSPTRKRVISFVGRSFQHESDERKIDGTHRPTYKPYFFLPVNQR